MHRAFAVLRASRALSAVRPACNGWSSMATSQTLKYEELPTEFEFGPLRIPRGQTFAATNLSYAFVNLKPLVPGHVLICPRRVTPKLAELAPEEVADVWQLAQAVGACMEAEFKADALTLAIQDGPAAGQTVPHVHIHCVPRHFKDLKRNDDIYDRIDEAEAQESAARQPQSLGGVDVDRKPRSSEEMAEEADRFRALMSESPATTG
eukprot:jgi/Ulvmu1/3118/UM015_0158.1